jgi:excisionase family DNA binding protein
VSDHGTPAQTAAACTPWLTIAQAAEYSHRGKRFLARQVAQGLLRAARVGGRGELLFRREWLDAWLEDLSTPIVMTPARRRA